MLRRLLSAIPIAAGVAVGALNLACGGQRAASPSQSWIVIGLDGAEWKVIRRLWGDGKLPNLRRLAERGVAQELRTRYRESPAIWTTIATGVARERHGITDFIVPTASGDVPVSSTLRRVPALWNMVSAAGLEVAVLGWWATWPAEAVNGILVSDRALLEVQERVHPPEFLAAVEAAERHGSAIGDGESSFPRDQVVAHLAEKLAGRGFDLLLAYLHGIDTVSHHYWRYFEPEAFPPTDHEDLAGYRERIPALYEAVDSAVGRIAAAAGAEANVVVLSDHGFRAAEREEVKVWWSLDTLLERLGYLVRGPFGVDFARTTLYGYASADHRRAQAVRLALAGREAGGRGVASEQAAIRRRLEADLARVLLASGEPAFAVRDATPAEARRGADFMVEVRAGLVTTALRRGAQELPGVIRRTARISGEHLASTHGVFIAAGPAIARGTEARGLSIFDLAPTVLYGLGLPVARDFDGRARTELFTEAFRASHPLRDIPSWGRANDGTVSRSAVDAELLDELRALGYLD